MESWLMEAESLENRQAELSQGQWRLLRGQLTSVTRELESLKEQHGVLRQRCETNLAHELETLKENHGALRMRTEMQHDALRSHCDDRCASLEEHRQRFDDRVSLLHSQHEALRERHDERCATLEESLGGRFEADKARHEKHRASMAELIALEQTGRRDALKDLRSYLDRRLAEEMGRVEASLVAQDRKLSDELSRVDASLSAQRSRTEAQIKAAMEEERNARETHTKFFLEQLDEERAMRDAQFQDARVKMEADLDRMCGGLRAKAEEEQRVAKEKAKLKVLRSVTGDSTILAKEILVSWKSEVEKNRSRITEGRMEQRFAQLEAQCVGLLNMVAQDREARACHENDERSAEAKRRLDAKRKFLGALSNDQNVLLANTIGQWRGHVKEVHRARLRTILEDRIGLLENIVRESTNSGKGLKTIVAEQQAMIDTLQQQMKAKTERLWKAIDETKRSEAAEPKFMGDAKIGRPISPIIGRPVLVETRTRTLTPPRTIYPVPLVTAVCTSPSATVREPTPDLRRLSSTPSFV